MSVWLLSLWGGAALAASLHTEPWGELSGQPVTLYTLTNNQGMIVKLTNYGGIITSIVVPDANGQLADVVLGFDNLQQYLDGHPCFGATIGRYANRIRNAQFTIKDKTYYLSANDGRHCIHGGPLGFDKRLWQSDARMTPQGPSVRLRYLSPDGEQGFPGNLNTTATFTLLPNNALHCRFEAVTDKPTYVSMTQHSYFNLNGCVATIHDHRIEISAKRYTEIDGDIVPTGRIGSVKGTEWDCTTMTRMGDHLHKLNYDGYHFNYIFDKALGEFASVIKVEDPYSGRTLEVSTTQPGVQFYSGNSIGTQYIGKNGIAYGPHMAFCLETQHYPDSPNHETFPSTLLQPGEKYDQTVIYRFGVQGSE